MNSNQVTIKVVETNFSLVRSRASLAGFVSSQPICRTYTPINVDKASMAHIFHEASMAHITGVEITWVKVHDQDSTELPMNL